MNAGAGSMNEGIESFLSGKLSQVDVRKIENELKQLWTQAVENPAENEQHPQVIRSCSSNIILYSDRADAETTDSPMLDEIARAHPARAILCICREGEKDRLEAWVTACCRLASPGDTRQICSEQITVLAEGNLEKEMLSLVESLILGDLPVFLWWTANSFPGEKLLPFLSFCRRFIVDSARTPYSFAFLRNLISLKKKLRGAVAISDLNWRRLLGIRAAVADEFEKDPFSLKDTGKINKVCIRSCAQELQQDECSVQALLFSGWMASRLNWEVISFGRDATDDCSKARFVANNRDIEVEFRTHVMQNGVPGSICEVEIEVSDGRKLRISRDPEGEAGSLVVIVSKDGKRIREILADDSDMDRVHLMGSEIEELSADMIFSESLSCAGKILELLEK